MPDTTLETLPSLKSLTTSEWFEQAGEIVEDRGDIERLGGKHIALRREGSSTLLVTFETLQGIEMLSPQAHPLGWHFADAHGWSQLTMISDGDTWFRDETLYAYFDRMVDDGYFDGFEHVMFYGAGPCGYAAAAFSVVAPGARVLVLQPQATLDAGIAGWDARFTEKRRLNFTDRYGYAPDMLEAANRAYIVFDPDEREDAMHAALFTRPNVTRLALRHMGSAIQTDLLRMEILNELIEAAARGRLSPARFARLARARRDHLPYLRRLLSKLELEGRTGLIRLLCRNVNARMRAPRFAKRLKLLDNPDP